MLLSLNQPGIVGKVVEIPSTLLGGVIFVVKIARFHLRISNKIDGEGLIRLPQWSTVYTIFQGRGYSGRQVLSSQPFP